MSKKPTIKKPKKPVIKSKELDVAKATSEEIDLVNILDKSLFQLGRSLLEIERGNGMNEQLFNDLTKWVVLILAEEISAVLLRKPSLIVIDK